MKFVGVMLIFTLVSVCSIAILSSGAFAFDGKRKGFLLGFGAGAGPLDGSAGSAGPNDYSGILDGDLPRSGVETDLKIGLGLSNRVLLYYTGKQSWPLEGSILGAFPMLGTTYYLSPADRSLFITGGLGAGVVTVVDFESAEPTSVGVAGYVGAGYEFTRHLYLEFDMTGRAKAENVTVLNLALTINALAF